MKLYFENSRKERRLIAEPENENNAYEEIISFLDSHQYAPPYTRYWKNNKDETVYDIGLHSEFFILTE